MSRRQRVWLLLAAFAGFGAVAFAIYHYRATQEFEITGELLYKNEESEKINDVRPVPGAFINVLQEETHSGSYDARTQLALLHISPNSRYSLLRDRQFALKLQYPGFYSSSRDTQSQDTKLAPLRLAPLSRMNWTWWESERLHNCRWASQLFLEALQSPLSVATTSTDINGHFWLKLRRGKYFVTAESEVPAFLRLEDDPIHFPDTSAPVPGNAFWNTPVTVTGNMRVVTAESDCSP